MANLTDSAREQWDDSAELYARLAPQISFYRETVRRIVAAAGLLPGMVVVDLASGSSGMLEHEVQRCVPDIQRLYCTDSSHRMLEVARSNINWEKVEFVVSRAEELHERLPAPVDLVLCNSSVWHFALDLAVDEIAFSLKPRGAFVFTLGEWDIQGSGVESNVRYEAIDEELRRRSLPPKPSRGSKRKLRLGDLQELLMAKGFCSVRREEFLIEVSAEDFYSFYQIPAIVRQSLPQLQEEIARDVLLKAMSTLLGRKLPPMRWMVVNAMVE